MAVVAAVLALRKMAKNQAILAIPPTKAKNVIMDLTAIVAMMIAKIANAIMVPIVIAVMIIARPARSNYLKNPCSTQ